VVVEAALAVVSAVEVLVAAVAGASAVAEAVSGAAVRRAAGEKTIMNGRF
jgi:hypothetical protein